MEYHRKCMHDLDKLDKLYEFTEAKKAWIKFGDTNSEYAKGYLRAITDIMQYFYPHIGHNS